MADKVDFYMVYMLDLDGRRGEPSARNERRFRADFARMREAGLTGVDLEGASRGVGPDTYNNTEFMLHMMDLCHEQGLKAIVNVMNGGVQRYLSPGSDEPGYFYEEAVRNDWIARDYSGRLTGSFNLCDPDWRERQMRPYLQSFARHYSSHPAFAGYRTGDTLMGSAACNDASKPLFQAWLREKYGDLGRVQEAWGDHLNAWEEVAPPRFFCPWSQRWEDWIEAQNDFLVQWAHDFAGAIRAVDPDTEGHAIRIFAPHWLLFGEEEMHRGFTKEFFRPFESVSAFANFPIERWTIDRALLHLERSLEMLRRLAPGKELGVMDFPGPRLQLVPDQMYPFERMAAIVRKALECGVRLIHYDGYRKSVKQTAVAFRQTFIFHQELLDQLASLHREVNG